MCKTNTGRWIYESDSKNFCKKINQNTPVLVIHMEGKFHNMRKLRIYF